MLLYLDNGLNVIRCHQLKERVKEQKKGPDIFACRVRCQLKLASAQFTIVFPDQASRVVPFTSCLNSTYYLDSSSLSLLEERCRSGRQIRLERI